LLFGPQDFPLLFLQEKVFMTERSPPLPYLVNPPSFPTLRYPWGPCSHPFHLTCRFTCFHPKMTLGGVGLWLLFFSFGNLVAGGWPFLSSTSCDFRVVARRVSFEASLFFFRTPRTFLGPNFFFFLPFLVFDLLWVLSPSFIPAVSNEEREFPCPTRSCSDRLTTN